LVKALYIDGAILIPDFDEANSLHQDGYGSFKHRRLGLTPCEALYLLDRNRIEVYDERGVKLSFKELLRRLSPRGGLLDRLGGLIRNLLGRPSTSTSLWIRYLIYRDLRMKGYVVREEANSLLVYERGSYPRAPPSYEVYPLPEGMPQPIRRLMEALERAEEGGRTLKIAVVDRRGEVVYYTLREMDFSGRLDDPKDSPGG